MGGHLNSVKGLPPHVPVPLLVLGRDGTCHRAARVCFRNIPFSTRPWTAKDRCVQKPITSLTVGSEPTVGAVALSFADLGKALNP